MENFKINRDLFNKIKEILSNHQNDQNNLLAILLEIQALIPENYIPEEVARYVHIELDTPISKIYDVITFFSALSDKPKGMHVVQLCKSTVCRLNKYQTLRGFLEKELGIQMGETTENGLFTLEYSACFGACDISPAFRIDDQVYGNLDEDKTIEIINSYRGANNG